MVKKLKIGDRVKINFLRGKPEARVSSINTEGKISVIYIASNLKPKKTKHFSRENFDLIK